MPTSSPATSQPAVAIAPAARSRGPRALRLAALIGFVISFAYVLMLIWNAVQYFQTFPSPLADPGLTAFVVRLPGVDLPVGAEVAIALTMLLLFVASIALLFGTRRTRAPSAPVASALAAADSAPGQSAQTPSDLPTYADSAHNLPLPIPPLPTVPPGEAAILVEEAMLASETPVARPLPASGRDRGGVTASPAATALAPSPLPASGRGRGGVPPRIFVSHSSADNEFGVRLARQLRERLGVDVWYDSDGGLQGGDDWLTRIQRELSERNVFILIISPKALQSPWVSLELRTALAQAVSIAGKALVPVLHVDPGEVEVPPFLARYQWVQFAGRDEGQALAELAEAVQLGYSRRREDASASLERLGPPFELGALQPTDHFVGREDDLAWVLDHLNPSVGGAGLASIAATNGFAGIGKSTLAWKAMQQVFAENRFPDGIAVVICKDLTDPATILRRALARFDPLSREPESRDLAELGRLAAALFAGRRALVVLDNVEPKWPIQQVVGPLRAAGVALLLTSRQELPTAAVPPEASKMLHLLPPEQALELFAQYYGRGAAPDLTPGEQADAGRIVKALGYHTLAVKLAATYALRRKRPLDALANEYEADPRLAQGLKDGDEAVIVLLDSSYAALPENAQRLLAALAAFPTADVGRNAVLAVAEALEIATARDGLDAIEDLRLAEPAIEEALTGEQSDRERVRLHPLVQSYAGKLFDGWDAEQRNATRGAVAAWYADYANAIAIEEADVEPDEDNITGAIELAGALGDDRLVARLADAMKTYWRDRSRTEARETYLPAGLTAAQQVAEAEDADREDRLRLAGLQLASAELAQHLGNLDAAEDYAGRSLAIYQQEHSRREEGVAVTTLGRIAVQRGDLDAAERYFQRAFEIDRDVGDLRGQAVDLGDLGDVALLRGDQDGAETRYEQYLAIMREVKDRREEGVAVSKLGDIALQRGDQDGAETRYEQALAISREVKDRRGEGARLEKLAQVALNRGQPEKAQQYFEQSLLIDREIKDRQGEAIELAQLAVIAAMQDHPDEAESRYREALGILRDVQDVANYAGVAVTFSEFLITQRGKQDEGCELLQEAIRLYSTMGLQDQAEDAQATARRLGCGT